MCSFKLLQTLQFTVGERNYLPNLNYIFLQLKQEINQVHVSLNQLKLFDVHPPQSFSMPTFEEKEIKIGTK